MSRPEDPRRAALRLAAPTRLDRAIAWVAPGYGVRRLRDRAAFAATAAASGYEGARYERAGLRRFAPKARTANEDTLPGLEDLRGRARDLARNAPLATGAIRTVGTNVVGEGLRVRPAVDRKALAGRGVTDAQAEAFEDAASREFALFAERGNCDAAGVAAFPVMQALAFRAVLESGDAFGAFVASPVPDGPFGFAVQLLEGDRVSNPDRGRDTNELVAGVALTPGGRTRGVWVEELGPADTSLTRGTWRFLPAWAENGAPLVLHLVERERIGQTRGVPYLAPVIGIMQDLRRFTDAEITAAVLTACIALTTTATGPVGPLAAEAQAAAAAQGGGEAPGGGGLSRAEIEFQPGLVLEGLQPGETIASFAPERPSSGFDGFFAAMVRQMGVALELPYEVLTKSFQSSYSASRAALLEAWRFFRARRAWLAREFCQPVYEMVLADAILRGRLTAPGFFEDPLARAAWCRAAWTGPAPGQIDPTKELEAAKGRIAARLSTYRRETAELTGEDWEAVARELAKEEAALADLGIPAVAPGAGVAAATGPTGGPPREGEDPADDERQAQDGDDPAEGEAEGERQAQEAAAAAGSGLA